jgi:hypothetical protein
MNQYVSKPYNLNIVPPPKKQQFFFEVSGFSRPKVIVSYFRNTYATTKFLSEFTDVHIFSS